MSTVEKIRHRESDTTTPRVYGAIAAVMSEPPKQPPYPLCRTPEKCVAKGYCQNDPNCGD